MCGPRSCLRKPRWSPLPEPLGPVAPSRADGTSPYLAVDNLVERIGAETLVYGKDQVKGYFVSPQGYPLNSWTIHRQREVPHRPSTRRPHRVHAAGDRRRGRRWLTLVPSTG